jgi:predicted AAA+ superfamily ATPase
MLRRKAYEELMEWKRNGKKPLLVYGQRQIGKTFIIEHFAKENYQTYIYTNLDEEASFRSIFEQPDRTVDNIILSIRTLRQLKEFDPKTTLIFLDEIQACPEAMSSLKSFKKERHAREMWSHKMDAFNRATPCATMEERVCFNAELADEYYDEEPKKKRPKKG